MASDVSRVARLAYTWRRETSVEEIAVAIVEVIVHLDVYRTYIGEPGMVEDADERVLRDALRDAAACEGVSAAVLELLTQAFFSVPAPGDALRAELVTRFQQISGPAMAKGVEDTALYVYVPLVSRNEVGGDPDRELDDARARAHGRNASRASDWPATMLATNTQDTKRSADLRSRLDALTTVPDQWWRHITRWRRLNKPHKRVVGGAPSPDVNTEYLYYQTLLGLWPAPRPARRLDDLPDRAWRARARERLLAYMQKAAREAKQRTSWTERDAPYEATLDAFVRATLEPSEDAPFLPDVARMTALVADNGFRNALARVVLHCMSPGTPDLYQGDELWNFTLVDPDNRRPVDFSRRAELLTAVTPAAGDDFPLADDRTKLALTCRLLRFRRDHAKLLRDGDYLPLLLADNFQDVFAFARRSDGEVCIVIVRTRPLKTGKREKPSPNAPLPDELVGSWQSVLNGRVIELVRYGRHLAPRLDDLMLGEQPCEVLWRSRS
jgi:(1->4)-alpha-D-glucan 1-alpha-D-glucosylmutase